MYKIKENIANVSLIALAIICLAVSVAMLVVQINRDKNASFSANAKNPVVVEETENDGMYVSVYHNGHRHCNFLHPELATKQTTELKKIVITNSVVFYGLLSVVIAATASLTVLAIVITVKDMRYERREKVYC